ncbi:pyrroloquinoline quinone biosynthesis protein B [Winogradskyella wandonensis]|uniref:Pyrroloquinoline quinone biosynthesis protein B n=1 Tax=Winogradskyella wandonensis TaxID=1442586 RepID=A0A4R1KNK8_9FLAO|nr:MBL fold metallo-hydrolase [Winogradskyella wandonensis]TCK65219.1 pyrroloquinoline quinone biosynthesis protein B [Winogradskyella wandonensis]
MKRFITICLILIIISCSKKPYSKELAAMDSNISIENTSIVILGTAQDAGSPQIGCKKRCCSKLFKNPEAIRKVVSLGLIDTEYHKTYLFEATPDITSQMKMITTYETQNENELVDGIFLTHAHIGHYTGLMYLGKEAIDATKTPVYTMPQMKRFLTDNGPWSQLVTRENITLIEIENEKPVKLSKTIEVTPILVPHRDEFSETVGYRIKGPNKTALFIPDIDKWDKWNKNIIDEIKKVDYAFVDATFFSGKEINNRDISEIPHPFVIESLDLFDNLPRTEKEKVIFIHFNHTNPLLNPLSEASKLVNEKGYKIAKINDIFEL